MKYFYIGLYCLVGMIVIAVLFLILRSIFKSPFKYPHYYVRFDISGKRAPNIDDLRPLSNRTWDKRVYTTL